MATMITDECINCGACEDECPTVAITMGETIFVIDPGICTECVGFFDTPQCSEACPVECCVPDPDHVETNERLLAKAELINAS